MRRLVFWGSVLGTIVALVVACFFVVHPADAYVDLKASRSSRDQTIPERGLPVPEKRQQRRGTRT